MIEGAGIFVDSLKGLGGEIKYLWNNSAIKQKLASAWGGIKSAFVNFHNNNRGSTTMEFLVGPKLTQKIDKWAQGGSKGSSNSNIITDPSRLLGTTANPQDHHIIPAFRGKSKPYADFIKNLEIDVDQYTITVSGGKGGMHMNFIHGKGKWNQKWMNFIDNNPNATAKDVYQFAGKMMDDYGLSGLKIHPYGK